jgi:hypothetical protein
MSARDLPAQYAPTLPLDLFGPDELREEALAKDVRLVDVVQPRPVRPEEMQVLCFGMSRTGTMCIFPTFSVNMFNILTILIALITALEILGIHSCHMKEVAPLTHCAEMWNDGLRAKYYGQGKPYGKKEFDKLLGNFGVRLPSQDTPKNMHYEKLQPTNIMIQAITDVPCIMFVDELTAAYPNAKVVLTNRDPDKWLVSMLSTIYVILSWDWERWAIPYITVGHLPPTLTLEPKIYIYIYILTK